MKRMTSIALLLLMAIASVQPTLSLHFCGGKFHSLQLNGNDADCCPHAETDNALPQNGERSLFNATDSCCNNYVIDASTDDFLQQEVAIHAVPSLSAFLPEDESIVRRCANLPLCRHIFPPDNCFVHNELLAQLCIFRI
ncbi:MAG: hypothetical protein LBS09_05845 [Bacteroidales bacterium]|nr:hypothetical protein [Bacteroidales bacterium]